MAKQAIRNFQDGPFGTAGRLPDLRTHENHHLNSACFLALVRLRLRAPSLWRLDGDHIKLVNGTLRMDWEKVAKAFDPKTRTLRLA